MYMYKIHSGGGSKYDNSNFVKLDATRFISVKLKIKTRFGSKYIPWHLLRKTSQIHCIKKRATLCILRSVCIFSILFSMYFLWCWQGEFLYELSASYVGNNLLYSCALNIDSGDNITGGGGELDASYYCYGSKGWPD